MIHLKRIKLSKNVIYIYVSLFIQLILVKISYFLLNMTIIIYKKKLKKKLKTCVEIS